MSLHVDEGTLISRFDSLQTQGRLFYDETDAEIVDSSGFKLQFRRIPCFDAKPLPEKPGKPKGNPFLEAIEEDFVISRSASHVLQLNKYCVYRPHLILHTREFAAQSDALDLSDFEAAWNVHSELDGSYVMFYNCGLDAGSSQPHKHMQFIPKPAADEFVLFPDLESDDRDKMNSAANGEGSAGIEFSPPLASSCVPYYCLIAYLPKSADVQGIHDVYERMLKATHPDYPDLTAHNVVMAKEWICVIPRRRRLMLNVPANAMGMMGLIWLGTLTERIGWTLMGKTWHLEALGCPPLQD